MSPQPAAAPATQATILVVDDDAKILAYSRELLEQHGYAVDTCQDSTAVIARIKAKPFDAVLLDIRMPGLEGTDLLPMIKRLKPALPLIIVSAFYDESNLSYYHQLGATDMIPKPFSHERLLGALARVLGHQERIPVTLTSLSLTDGRDMVYRKLMLLALQKTEWNQVKAAELLGVSRYWLIRWMKRLKISSET
jgi:DNA-binding NtrC family response regulator